MFHMPLMFKNISTFLRIKRYTTHLTENKTTKSVDKLGNIECDCIVLSVYLALDSFEIFLVACSSLHNTSSQKLLIATK